MNNLQTASARLIVFSRFPQPGSTKTRLIPALGAQGAADLQRRMTEHIIKMARGLKYPTMELEIRHAGGSKSDIAAWLGNDIIINSQAGDDLGQRLRTAMAEVFAMGDCRLVAIGADCPAITGEIIDLALGALADNDLVIGPTEDGGYYLIGMNAAHPHLFMGISWGSSLVLAQTMARAMDGGMRVELLPVLPDIDRPEDLAQLPAALLW